MVKPTKTPLAVASLLAGLLVSGCADQVEALIFLHAPAWPSDEGYLSCSVDASSDTYWPRGALDVAFNSAYWMPGIILNNLAATNPAANDTLIENAEVQLLDADVRLGMPQDPEIIDIIRGQNEALVEFKVNMPTNSIEPGERHAILLEAVTPSTTAALRPLIRSRYCSGDGDCDVRIELLANVVVNAKRTGSSGKMGIIHTREFTYPIDLCDGCLGSCALCPGGVCPPGGVSEWIGGVCGNAQDAPLYPVECTQSE